MDRQVTVISFFAIICFSLVACKQAQPALEYQKDVTTMVVYVNARNAPVGGEVGEVCNHIPDLRVWGDGRVVYSQYQQEWKRIVKTGYLDTLQIQSMLQLLADSGFFQENTPEIPNPAGTGYDVQVNLKSGTYRYSWSNKPSVYSDLTSIVDSYDLAEFTPEKALLVSSPYYPSYPPKDELAAWPSQFGFSLAEADKGYWVSGDVLSYLWQTVNNTQYVVPKFREANRIYAIALQITGISLADPPFDCWGSMKTIQP